MNTELVKSEAGAVVLAPNAGDLFSAIVGAIKSGEVTAEKVAAMDGNEAGNRNYQFRNDAPEVHPMP